MTSVVDFLENDLLAIPDDRPDLLFCGDPDKDKTIHQTLRNKWHPDRHDPARRDIALKVFSHVELLFDRYNTHRKNGTWKGRGKINIPLADSKGIAIPFIRQYSTDVGNMYLGNSKLTLTVKNAHEPLWRNGTSVIENLKFADDKMKAEMQRYLPLNILKWNGENERVMMMDRPPGSIFLSDLKDHLGVIPPEHVTWMLTRFYSLLCYLQWSRIVHNNIALNTVVISPEDHSITLLGGWWFAKKIGEPLLQLPAQSAILWKSLPNKLTQHKLANPRLDQELVKSVARTLLGDSSGTTLLHDPKIPKALAQWVTLPASGNAFTEFRNWEIAREKSFAIRRFVKFDVSASDIYGT